MCVIFLNAAVFLIKIVRKISSSRYLLIKVSISSWNYWKNELMAQNKGTQEDSFLNVKLLFLRGRSRRITGCVYLSTKRLSVLRGVLSIHLSPQHVEDCSACSTNADGFYSLCCCQSLTSIDCTLYETLQSLYGILEISYHEGNLLTYSKLWVKLFWTWK